MGICGSGNNQSKSKVSKRLIEDNGSARNIPHSPSPEMKDIETFNRRNSMTAPPKVNMQLLEPDNHAKKQLMVEPNNHAKNQIMLEPSKKFQNIWEEMGMENPDDHNQKDTKTDPANYKIGGDWTPNQNATEKFDSAGGFIPSKWTGVAYSKNPNPFKKTKDLQCDGVFTIKADGTWKITEDTYEKVIFFLGY
jgi:hypothetical protein